MAGPTHPATGMGSTWMAVLLCLLAATSVRAQTPPPAASDTPSATPARPPATTPVPVATPITVDPADGSYVGTSPPPVLGDAYKVVQGMFFQLTQPALFDSDADVERKVGDPWSLNPGTAARMDALPPRVRLLLYNTLADQLGSLVLVPNLDPLVDGAASRERYHLTMQNGAGDRFMNDVGNTVRGQFSPDELVDAGVFILSRYPFFPKDQAGWNLWKHIIVRYDVWFSLATLLGLLGTDQGTLQASKWLFTVREKYRVGAFAFVSGLGVNLRPQLRGSMRATAPALDVSADFVENINAPRNAEQRALEWNIREHWLQSITRAVGLELAASANARYVWLHGDPAKQNTYSSGGELYWRANSLLGFQSLSLMGSVNANTDFRHQVGAGSTVSLENTLREFAVVFRVAGSSNRTTGQRDYHLALVLGGALVPQGDVARASVSASARRVRLEMACLARINIQLAELEAHWTDDPATADAARQEELRVAMAARAQSLQLLQDSLAAYAGERERFFRLHGMGSPGAPDTLGPLTPEELAPARMVAGSPTPTP